MEEIYVYSCTQTVEFHTTDKSFDNNVIANKIKPKAQRVEKEREKDEVTKQLVTCDHQNSHNCPKCGN